ncbi:YmfQ family protein [Frateuria sp. YIM B11624]|uniref:YmfQ family protein n=1 Tax=Frateuria sp. YIM B11624 TaxID=3143185 RepID=UPI003C74A1F2
MTVAQYREHLRALLPPGRALEDGDGLLTQLLEGMAEELARVDGRGDALIAESLPDSTLELLPDWERVADLPDDCTPAGQTVEARRTALIARLTANSGPSIPFLLSLAASLGYTVQIVKRYARRYRAALGDVYGGNDWQFVWEVHAPLNTVTYRRFGNSTYGEAYASWQNDVLECVMRQHNPADLQVNFIYS